MSKIFTALMNGLIRSRTDRARALVRRELLAKTDYFLEDIGVSRVLLEEGVGAWPWRIDELGNNETRDAAPRRSSSSDFFTQPDFAAMGLASRGASGFSA